MSIKSRVQQFVKAFKVAYAGKDISDVVKRSVRDNFFGYTSLALSEADTFQGWSFVCLDRRATSISSAKFTVKKRLSRGETAPVQDWHPLHNLLTKPTPSGIISKAEFWRLASLSYDMTGNTYIFVDFRTNRVRPQMWVLPPTCVQIVYGQRGVLGYVFESGSVRQAFDFNEIIHLKDLRPGGDLASTAFEGTSRLHAAASAILADKEMVEFVQRFYKDDATPPLALFSEDPINDEDWTAFREKWNNKVPLAKVVGVLDDSKDIRQISTSNPTSSVKVKDVDEGNFKKICAVFNIPPSLLTSQYQNKATAQEVRDEFNATMHLLASNWAEKLTAFFQTRWPDIVIEVDEFEISSPEERRAAKTFSRAYKTVGEVRKEEGLPATEFDKHIILPQGQTIVAPPVPVKEQKPAPKSDDTGGDADGSDTNDNQEKQLVRNIRKALKSQADKKRELSNITYWKSLEKVMNNGRDALKKQLSREFERLETTYLASEKLNKEWVSKRMSKEDWEQWQENFWSSCSPEVQRIVREAAEVALGDIDQEWEADLLETMVRETTAAMASKIKEPVTTVKEDLEKLLKSLSGEPKEDIAKAIRTKFSQYKSSRADMIAQTTATAASGRAQTEVFTEFEFEYVWLSQRDGSVRKSHREADGKKPDEEGYFHVGRDKMKSPGTGSIASENVRCQCTLRAIPKEDEE